MAPPYPYLHTKLGEDGLPRFLARGMLNASFVNGAPCNSRALYNTASKRAANKQLRQASRGSNKPKRNVKEILQHLPISQAFRFCELCGESGFLQQIAESKVVNAVT